MSAAAPLTDEQQLEELQAGWPGWRVWRTRDGDEPAWWAATRLDPAAGPSATVMGPTVEKLRAELVDQARRAARGELIYEVARERRYGGGR